MSETKERIPMDDIVNTILDKKFKKVGANGYSDAEVDAFLDAICDVVEELQANMEQVKQQLNESRAANDTLEARLQAAKEDLSAARAMQASQPVVAPVAAPAADQTDDIKEILVMAQRLKAETLAGAQQKADQIIADAKVQAEAQLGDLSTRKENLEKQVEGLKATAAGFKDKLNALLELTREAVDAAEL